jgi:hypothetical protein
MNFQYMQSNYLNNETYTPSLLEDVIEKMGVAKNEKDSMRKLILNYIDSLTDELNEDDVLGVDIPKLGKIMYVPHMHKIFLEEVKIKKTLGRTVTKNEIELLNKLRKKYILFMEYYAEMSASQKKFTLHWGKLKRLFINTKLYHDKLIKRRDYLLDKMTKTKENKKENTSWKRFQS